MEGLNEDYAPEFLTQLYRIFFEREPDPAGFQNYMGQLEAGRQPHEVVAEFLRSKEFNALRQRKISSPGPATPETSTAAAIPEPEPDQQTNADAEEVSPTGAHPEGSMTPAPSSTISGPSDLRERAKPDG
jgi:hypothetical protein